MDGQRKAWLQKGCHRMLPKRQGVNLMVSGYITEDGFLGAPIGMDTTVTIEPGAADGKDDWWNAEQMLKQFREKVLPAFHAVSM